MTIKDIARLSGYGVSTVSRALNGHPDVNEETRQKIADIVKKYKFEPNANARQLKQTVSKSILLIVKGKFNVFFSPIIEYIQNSMDATGYDLITQYLDEEEDEIKSAEKLCREKKPLGILFLGGDIESFRRGFGTITVPSVLCTTRGDEIQSELFSSVSVDDVEGGRIAADYLLDCGHRHIGILHGNFTASYPSKLRYDGCRLSFENRGLPEDTLKSETCAFSMASAYEATKALLEKNPEITAVFAMSDTMAIGAIRAILDTGKRVPEDISVIGFDGTEIAGYYNPVIATVRQPAGEIAAISLEQLYNLLDNRVKSNHILLRSRLVEGASVRRLGRP